MRNILIKSGDYSDFAVHGIVNIPDGNETTTEQIEIECKSLQITAGQIQKRYWVKYRECITAPLQEAVDKELEAETIEMKDDFCVRMFHNYGVIVDFSFEVIDIDGYW